jgi:hypothetical protein
MAILAIIIFMVIMIFAYSNAEYLKKLVIKCIFNYFEPGMVVAKVLDKLNLASPIESGIRYILSSVYNKGNAKEEVTKN